MVVFTLSRRATWPFPPWTHLNFSVMIIQRLYLCSTLVLGGSTDYLELCWLVETLCLGWSWWFSPCHVMLLGPSLHGTHLNFSVMIIQRLYLCSTLVLGGSTDLLELYWLWKSCVWAGHGGFHPVTSCYLALPSMDPPQFLCYNYTKAIFVFHIGVGW